MTKHCFSINEAAEFSGLSKWTLYQYSARGKLPVLKVGTRTLILKEEFVQWLHSHKRPSRLKGGEE